MLTQTLPSCIHGSTPSSHAAKPTHTRIELATVGSCLFDATRTSNVPLSDMIYFNETVFAKAGLPRFDDNNIPQRPVWLLQSMALNSTTDHVNKIDNSEHRPSKRMHLFFLSFPILKARGRSFVSLLYGYCCYLLPSPLAVGLLCPLLSIVFLIIGRPYLFRQSSHLSCRLPRFLQSPCVVVSDLFGGLSSFILTKYP